MAVEDATKHPTGTHEEWLRARLELLEAEKAHTRWLDRAPLGRNENGPWWKRRHEYDAA